MEVDTTKRFDEVNGTLEIDFTESTETIDGTLTVDIYILSDEDNVELITFIEFSGDENKAVAIDVNDFCKEDGALTVDISGLVDDKYETLTMELDVAKLTDEGDEVVAIDFTKLIVNGVEKLEILGCELREEDEPLILYTFETIIVGEVVDVVTTAAIDEDNITVDFDTELIVEDIE